MNNLSVVNKVSVSPFVNLVVNRRYDNGQEIEIEYSSDKFLTVFADYLNHTKKQDGMGKYIISSFKLSSEKK